MKNFDEEREARVEIPEDQRTFQLGGETFLIRDAVRPEVFAPLDEMKPLVQSKTDCVCGHTRVQHVQGRGACNDPACSCIAFVGEVVEKGSSLAEILDAFDAAVLACLADTDGGRDRWKALRRREDNPVEMADIRGVLDWIQEVQSARPTQRPGSSSPGPSETGTTSTENSSSQDSPAAQAA